MQYVKSISCILVYLCLCSCSSYLDKEVKAALEFALSNKVQLEQVLEHYKGEPLKQKAARYLIANMPYYYSYRGAELDSIKKVKVLILNTDTFPYKEVEKWESIDYTGLEKVYDIHTITADYLIRNIDHAFEKWSKRTWNINLTFEDFSEFLLPYRTENEPLEDWREKYEQKYGAILDSLYKGSDIIEAANVLGNYIKKEGFFYDTSLNAPHYGASFLFDHRIGGCKESCDYTTYVMRAVGIPIGVDTYLYSPEFRFSHEWNVIKDTTGMCVSFWIEDNTAQRGKHEDRKKGKVYRRSFGWQEKEESARLYPVFQNPFIKDVTAEYLGQNQVVLDMPDTLTNTYIYLAVFSYQKWVPVAVTTVKNGQAVFEDIEPEVIFQPVVWQEEQIIPVSYPFIYREKEVQTFIPRKETEVVELLRKYPHNHRHSAFMSNLIGGVIEASNDLNFKQSEFVYKFVDTLSAPYNVVFLGESKKSYRYMKYTANNRKKLELAELVFFENPKDEQGIHAIVSSSCVPNNLRHDGRVENVADGDPFSYFTAKEEGGSILFDFQTPKAVEKIVYTPRNDDNYVRIGDTYMLYYQNGSAGWKSLGQQTATTNKLLFENVPQGVLLCLHNITRGTEEQVFYMKNGKQVFCGGNKK